MSHSDVTFKDSDEEFDDSKYEEEDYSSLEEAEALNVDEYSKLNEKDIVPVTAGWSRVVPL